MTLKKYSILSINSMVHLLVFIMHETDNYNILDSTIKNSGFLSLTKSLSAIKTLSFAN